MVSAGLTVKVRSLGLARGGDVMGGSVGWGFQQRLWGGWHSRNESERRQGPGDPPVKANGVNAGAQEVGTLWEQAGLGEGVASSGLGRQGPALGPEDIRPKCLDNGHLGRPRLVTVGCRFSDKPARGPQTHLQGLSLFSSSLSQSLGLALDSFKMRQSVFT